jgi:hypothetical protein
MSKSNDNVKQQMVYPYEEPMPYVSQHHMMNNPSMQNPFSMSGEEDSQSMDGLEKEQLSYYMPNQRSYQQDYFEFPGDDYRSYGMSQFYDSDRMSYPMMSNMRQRSMFMERDFFTRGRSQTFSGDPRYHRSNRHFFDKEQLKNDIEELNKDSMHWKNLEAKDDLDKEKYDGLMDISKTIKKDYNKKKWRKMTQELV